MCSNMDKPSDYHTMWSKSDKDKYQMISFVGIFVKWYKWTYFKKRQTHRLRKQINVYQIGEVGEGHKGGWD